ncbi:MAG: hypothetical protein ACU84Q_13835 [Gammaproteobacteria bacterium]|jgi:hypothetical protein
MAETVDQPRKPLGKRIIHEIVQVWIMTAYFAAGFILILLMQNLLLAEQGADQIGLLSAIILALLIGKVVVVMEHLAVANRFRHRRRIGHVVYSTVLFTLVSLLVGAIEKVIKGLIHGESLGGAIVASAQHSSLEKFLATTIALLLLFGILFFFREVNHLLGKGVLMKALFQPPDET